MDKPGVSFVSIQMIKTLDAHLKNPRDTKLIGKSSKFKIGFTNKFNNVKVAPAVRKEFNPPLILNAGIITVRKYRATALIKKDFKIFFTPSDFILFCPYSATGRTTTIDKYRKWLNNKYYGVNNKRSRSNRKTDRQKTG